MTFVVACVRKSWCCRSHRRGVFSLGALCAFSTADVREDEKKCHYQPNNESDNCAKRNMIHRILRASGSAKRQPYARNAANSRALVDAGNFDERI
jgi:hypothetical protein